MSIKNSWVWKKIDIALFTPIKALKKRYIPLLLIYFAYGASTFASIALSFFEKESLSLSAENIVAIAVWGSMPWTLKMVIGQLVDHVSIMGNRRKSYIFLGALFLVVASVLLAGQAGEYGVITSLGSEYALYLTATVALATGFMIQDVTADTMSTEVVSRKEIRNEQFVDRSVEDIRSDLAMVQVLGRLAFSLAAFAVAGLGGWMTDNMSYDTIFWLILVLPVLSCIGAMFVELNPDQKLAKQFHRKQALQARVATDDAFTHIEDIIPAVHKEIDVDEALTENGKIDPKILGGGIAFAIFSVVMAMSDIVLAQEIIFGVSLVLLSFMFKWVTTGVDKKTIRTIILVFIALFAFRLIPKVGPGLTWWAIDVLGFDGTFFGVLRQVGTGVALVVLWLGADFIAKQPLRKILIVLVVMQAIFALPELLVYNGFHELINVSPRAIFLVDTAVDDPIQYVSMIPVLAIIAYYAPAANRGTWFAIGASLMNLAITGSQLLTKYLNKLFVVTREVKNEAGEIVTTADYSQLGDIMIIKIAFIILISLAATLIFLDKKQRV